MTLPRPCTAAEAVHRASLLLNRTESYVLGTGTYLPAASVDLPFTRNPRGYGCDCYGFVTWCFKTPRHRPGYNHGKWATVSDDVNCDSSIEQAEHFHEIEDRLWESVDRPALGDLLVYPSIRGPDRTRLRIGHVGIIVKLCAEWDPKEPQYGLLTVIQCQSLGAPAIKLSTGVGWLHRESFKGGVDKAWRSRILRSVP